MKELTTAHKLEVERLRRQIELVKSSRYSKADIQKLQQQLEVREDFMPMSVGCY